MKSKKKIIIDLDVVTVAKWDKGKGTNYAGKFIAKVEKRKYCLITPAALIQLVKKWKHEKLRSEIASIKITSPENA